MLRHSYFLVISTPRWNPRRFSTSSPPPPPPPPPLFRLDRAVLRNLDSPTKELSWTISDLAKEECWSIVSPSNGQGGRLRSELLSMMVGNTRPVRSETNERVGGGFHPSAHPFLQEVGKVAEEGEERGGRRISHVSFSNRRVTSSSSSAGGFVDYSARYGAIREEDKVTLWERLMETLGVEVGNVARIRLVPDPERYVQGREEEVGILKWSDEETKRKVIEKWSRAGQEIKRLAPLVNLGEELLHRPWIALSNGQARRAKILSSLITGAELVVLEEPFTGLDSTTRDSITELMARLHRERRPRVILVLREQDPLPGFVTHLLRIDERGRIVHKGEVGAGEGRERDPRSWVSEEGSERTFSGRGGRQVVLGNVEKGVGRGISDLCSPPLVEMRGVSIRYGSSQALEEVDFRILPGDRTILAGDNGSGKTTLLSLILGDHPMSYAIPPEKLRLFGRSRMDRENSTKRIKERVGHFSPELFNAFPRRSEGMGGLSVGEAIATGFESIFSRRSNYTDLQKRRVWGLIRHFRDLINTPPSPNPSTCSREEEEVRRISSSNFSQLGHGSQAVVLLLRSIVHSPELLVLDEPFQGMDARQVERCRHFLDSAGSEEDPYLVGMDEEERERDRERRRRMAIVLVSHYEAEWPTSFGRLLRLKQGRVDE
ncbi:P-loop containing nucleoside triphosphate hydrolase protein, partial [Violaceomyces palustris]